jgi:hypothetical protein
MSDTENILCLWPIGCQMRRISWEPNPKACSTRFTTDLCCVCAVDSRGRLYLIKLNPWVTLVTAVSGVHMRNPYVHVYMHIWVCMRACMGVICMCVWCASGVHACGCMCICETHMCMCICTYGCACVHAWVCCACAYGVQVVCVHLCECAYMRNPIQVDAIIPPIWDNIPTIGNIYPPHKRLSTLGKKDCFFFFFFFCMFSL